MSPKVELLAPAGSPEAFYGAIHAGADAVYLAGNRFGARAYADNFTTEELVACIRYAHIWGRRVYLTVNTLVKEEEFDELLPYLTPFYEAGLDGVIVQDIGVFSFIKEHFPDMELHVSTQMTLTSVYGASLLKKMGAVRVVPARELSLEELIEMKKQTGLEIEAFIHGAMCYCYSGQCLFSSILGGRSGNRGRCAQPCRLPYKVERAGKTGRECYPLSLKDMCTIEHIPELIEAGIDSFKIEGRMKKPEYAAGVTAIYRKYIDRYYAGESCKVSQADLEALGKLYIRSERQDGYYYRHNSKDMVTLNSPSYSGTDDALLLSIKNQYLDKRPKLSLQMEVVFQTGRKAELVVGITGQPALQVMVQGDMVTSAMKQPITEENIRKQFGKLGDTVFSLDELKISLEDGAFYPLKAMNELRRKATLLLEELIIQKNGLCVSRQMPSNSLCGSDLKGNLEKSTKEPAGAGNFHVLVRTMEQFNTLTKYSAALSMTAVEADLVYETLQNGEQNFWKQCKALHQAGCLLVIALPPILRKRDEAFLKQIWNTFDANRTLFHGFLVRSMDGLGFLETKCKEDSVAVYADAGLYIWNQKSMECLSLKAQSNHMKLKGFCIPYELKAAEQRQLLKGASLSEKLNVEKVIYGRIPLMLTANCVTNTTQGCDHNGKDKVCFLTDRYQKQFPVLRNCVHCMNIIYNSLPLSLHGEMEKWQGVADFRLNFTIEDGRETEQILDCFINGGRLPYQEYTTGHEKRGVE